MLDENFAFFPVNVADNDDDDEAAEKQELNKPDSPPPPAHLPPKPGELFQIFVTEFSSFCLKPR
jgi:hypothetical protein